MQRELVITSRGGEFSDMQMLKKPQKIDKIYLILSCQIILYFTYRFIWYSNNVIINFCDFRLRWRELQYILSGIDPVAVINDTTGQIRKVVDISSEGGSLPWTYIYNMILCIPWVNENQAAWIYQIGQILIVTALNIQQYKELTNGYKLDKFEQAYLLIQMNFGLCAVFNIQTGNPGFIIPQTILYQLLTFNKSSEHEWIQISLICISLNKPQIAALFCLMMLVFKPVKTVICGQIFIGIPWIVQQIMVRENPIQMALNFWRQAGSNYNDGVVAGWLNPWIAEGYIDRQTGQLVTMGITIAVVVAVQIWNKRMLLLGKIIETEAIFKQAQIIAVLTIGWMYVNKMDYYIAFIAVILTVIIWKQQIKVVDIVLASMINIMCIQRIDVVMMGVNNLGLRIYQNLIVMILWILWLIQTNINTQSKFEWVKLIQRTVIIVVTVIQIGLAIMGIKIV